MFQFFPNAKRLMNSLLNLITDLVADGLLFFRLLFRSRTALSAEVLFLRKQLAFYQERQVQPRRLNDSARFSLVLLSRFCNWKEALVIVKPETLIGWHRKGFKLFWKWKSQAGRPRIPENIGKLIVQMAQENPTWGQARVAAELSVKLGIYVSPRTVRTYWPPEPERRGHRRTSSQNWRTFVRNHAQPIVACDFLVVVTARFRTLYVFLLVEVGTRRIVHLNVTAHPTAAWTLQQLREGIPSDHSYRFIIHDHDAIFSEQLDAAPACFGLEVMRTPVRSPQANTLCGRPIGTMRRECLDWIIPLTEERLRRTLRSWSAHYNRGRPHSALGPSVPDRSVHRRIASQRQRHRFDRPGRVVARPTLNGLHHEYHLLAHAA